MTAGSPSSTFKLRINGVVVELGDSKTPRGTPCFRSTMSSGDRNTLALAFFLVQLQQRSDIGNLTVVFDDPLTSLDRFRQQFTRDRPVMEGYLRSTYHGNFAEKEWLGEMIGRIRDAAPGQPLEAAKPVLADLESLNDFTKRYHRDDNSPKHVKETSGA
jgi:wobble nucleotide-excising tRNase